MSSGSVSENWSINDRALGDPLQLFDPNEGQNETHGMGQAVPAVSYSMSDEALSLGLWSKISHICSAGITQMKLWALAKNELLIFLLVVLS